MPFSPFGAGWPEPSARVGFAGNPLDRRSEQRGELSASDALAQAGARAILIAGGRFWSRPGALPYFPAGEVPVLGAATDCAVLLGWDESGPMLAAALPPDAAPPSPIEVFELRTAYAQGLFPAPVMGILAQAAAMVNWHATHGFCARCGHASEPRAGGSKRQCPNCAAEHFPRTDPVAIMLAALPDGRCLLGRGRHFAPGMYSCLAGFIEPGETVEDAVRRETFEESGIRLGRVTYHASQPWPFPHSLMIGCMGEALGAAISRDESELEDCRWFPRAEVLAMLAGAHEHGLRVPPADAIATHLIRAWAEGG